MSMVLWFVWNLHCASDKKSSTWVYNLLSNMQVNTFPGMERSKIPW